MSTVIETVLAISQLKSIPTNQNNKNSILTD